MSDIYVFPKDSMFNGDFDTMGLVGALEPTEAVFKEVANGESSLYIKHPFDEYGKYKALQRGNILICSVPTRMVPEINEPGVQTVVWNYKVKKKNVLTSRAQRTLYKRKSGDKKIKVLHQGTKVVVTKKPEGETRWKVKCSKGTGWMDPEGLELIDEVSGSFDSVAKSEMSKWQSVDQPFRIYEIGEDMDGVEVRARHITYDLLYDITMAEFNGRSKSCKYYIDNIMDNSMGKLFDGTSIFFEAYTNVTSSVAGLNYLHKNLVNAFLDPEDGICSKFKASLIRDGFTLYFLANPGQNRGIILQYGKNLTGVNYSVSEDEVVTMIIPIGEKKDGSPLYLSDGGYSTDNIVLSNHYTLYPHPCIHLLNCDNCKVGEEEEGGGKVTVDIARQRMLAQANSMFEAGCDMPKVTVSIEFVDLGETEEYTDYKNLESVYLYDYVTVQHPYLFVTDSVSGEVVPLNITVQVSEIEWDCILDRMKSVVVGNTKSNLSNMGLSSWQIPSGINGSKISSGSLGAQAFSDGAVGTSQLAEGSITYDKLADNSVITSKLADGSVTTNKLSDSSVTNSKMATDAIETDAIKNGAVTTNKLDDSSVTSGKLAEGCVRTSKILDGEITSSKFANDVSTYVAGIADNRIRALYPQEATSSASGLMSSSDKTKLDGIESGAEVNVNADWNSSSGSSEILNKPTTINGYGITDCYTKSEVAIRLYTKLDSFSEVMNHGQKKEFEFSTDSTSAQLFMAIGSGSIMYVYSNGFLAPVATNADINVSLKADGKTVYIENNSSTDDGILAIVSSSATVTVAEVISF